MSNYLLRKLGWGCVLAGLSSSVYAVDGVVLIDQAHALAGNITPGDTPGFPVTISLPGAIAYRAISRCPMRIPRPSRSLPTTSSST
jgi:hypothetical protein